MPELPEVQTVVRSLLPIRGCRVGQVIVARRDVVHPRGIDLASLVSGKAFRSIARRGKRIVFTLDNGARFYVHLGMSGALERGGPDSPTLAHTHVVFRVDQQELRFIDPRRFGGVWWLGQTFSRILFALLPTIALWIALGLMAV